MCLAAKVNCDLLHLRKDPFHYKSGTHIVIRPISQEAISKRGGEGRLFKGHLSTATSTALGKAVFCPRHGCKATGGSGFSTAGVPQCHRRQKPKGFDGLKSHFFHSWFLH